MSSYDIEQFTDDDIIYISGKYYEKNVIINTSFKNVKDYLAYIEKNYTHDARVELYDKIENHIITLDIEKFRNEISIGNIETVEWRKLCDDLLILYCLRFIIYRTKIPFTTF
jgi:hypothetical protein